MKSKLNNLFFYIGRFSNNYDMLLTCMKTELSQRRYDTAKKIRASLKKIDSSRLHDFMEEFFITSVMEDDVQNLDFWIETGYMYNSYSGYIMDSYLKDTPTLIWVIQNKKTACAKKLFEAGFDVNELDENDCTAFLWAVKEESLSLVKTFIEKADINVQDSFGITPLLSAVQNKNEQITKLLIKKKANQYFVFSKLIEQKDISLIKWFIEKGADINTQNKDGNFAETRIKWWEEQQNKDGKSALHLAVQKGNIELVKLLIKAGADVNISNNYGWTALHFAVRDNAIELVKLLLKAGADVNMSNDIGWTVLHFLPLDHDMIENYKKILQLLLSAGADINAQTIDGLSALHFATFVDLSPKTTAEKTFEHVKLLLNSGADINLQNNRGETVLHLAVRDNAIELVKLLLNSGADINLQKNDGETALHFAVRDNAIELVKLLLDNGADKDLPDHSGKTAFDYAIQRHHKNIARLLNPDADIETLTMLSNLIEKQNQIVLEQQNAIHALSGELNNLSYEQQQTRTLQEQHHKERLEIEEERLRREEKRRNNDSFWENWRTEEEREWRKEVLEKLS